MATYKTYDADGTDHIFETLGQLRRALGLTAAEIRRVSRARGTCKIRNHEILIFRPRV